MKSKDYHDDLQKAVFDRVMEYAGKSRKEVVSPRLTARETIALADYISAIIEKLDSSGAVISDLMKINCSISHAALAEHLVNKHKGIIVEAMENNN